MVKVALFVRLEAKPGKEKEVESFLVSGLPIVNEEPATTAWFGIRLGPSTFGIFDAFPDEAGRQAHLSGKVAAALMAKAGGAVGGLRSAQRQHVLAGFVAYACPSWTLNVDSARGLAMRGIAGGQMAIMAGWQAGRLAGWQAGRLAGGARCARSDTAEAGATQPLPAAPTPAAGRAYCFTTSAPAGGLN